MSNPLVPHAQARPYFQPPPGGDFTLQSSDGVEFRVHTVILSMVSSVFRDLLVVGSAGKDDIVHLTEDAQTISFMLCFIYPTQNAPDIPDIAALRSCLEVARKCDLSVMQENIDIRLNQPGFELYLEPLDLYNICVEYNLSNTRASAAQRLVAVQHKLLDPKCLAEFALAHPSHKHMIALVGAQGVRQKILADTLLRFNGIDLELLHDLPPYFRIACSQCQDRIKSGGKEGVYHPPGWLTQWSKTVNEALSMRPLDQCARYFDAAIFDSFSDDVPADCNLCIHNLSTNAFIRDEFNGWVREVRTLLEDRLAALDLLYQLC
ncbi:hypothetical protein FRC10_001248 [Ceratobasidium sp. 414]|nr:hypothetical protein FRC10_001248 [Ceratobasidium sp. 414]